MVLSFNCVHWQNGSVVAAPYRARSCAGTIRHVHLSVGNDPATEMTVSFSSERSFHTPITGGVLFGTTPDQLDTYVEEEQPARSYNVTPVKKEHGHYYSPFLHHITIKDLEPSSTYYYKCVVRKRNEKPPVVSQKTALRRTDDGEPRSTEEVETELIGHEHNGGSSGDFMDEDNLRRRQRARFLRLLYYDSSVADCPPPNKVRSFTTAPPSGTNNGLAALKFVYMGDIGQFIHSMEMMFHMAKHHQTTANAVILAGDIAYTGYDNRRWDTFFDFMDDFSAMDRVPLQVCAGNHDIDKQKRGKDIFLAYEHRFRMPSVQPAQLGTYDGPSGYMDMDVPPYPLSYEWGNAYYAFTYGASRHIFLNAYSSMEPDSQQYQWLLQELNAVNREETPWVLVTIHVPMYNTFHEHRHDKQIEAAKEHLEELFVQYRVNLVINGHIHAYQRTHTVAHGNVSLTGPMHVIVGAGGRECKASFMSEEPEPWVAARDATHYGYGVLQLHNRTHAEWTWIRTGKSEYQDRNLVWKQSVTLPALQETDSVILENQYFLD